MTRRILSIVSAALWVGVGIAAFVTMLDPQVLGASDPAFAVWFAVVVVPPIAVGLGCLVARGGGMVVVAVFAFVVFGVHGFLFAFGGEGGTHYQVWGYLLFAAVGAIIVWATWAWIEGLLNPERVPEALDPVSEPESVGPVIVPEPEGIGPVIAPEPEPSSSGNFLRLYVLGWTVIGLVVAGIAFLGTVSESGLVTAISSLGWAVGWGVGGVLMSRRAHRYGVGERRRLNVALAIPGVPTLLVFVTLLFGSMMNNALDRIINFFS